MSKTVIMIWSKTDSGTHPNGSIKTYGLGDLLRGTIFLHQMSVRLGFNLVVDLSMHPISKHLIVTEHAHAQYVNANIHKTHIVHCHETNKFNVIYKASLGTNEPLLICTNMFCNEPLSVECKQFMKTLLTPNEPFANYMIQQNAAYDVSLPYSIMHIRLGDDEFFENGIAMFNTRPLHFGELSTMFRDNVAESFKETLYEFFVLGNASSIKTYSVYDWVSGFVKFAGLIHDVPVIDLKVTPRVQMPQLQTMPQFRTGRVSMLHQTVSRNKIRFGLNFKN